MSLAWRITREFGYNPGFYSGNPCHWYNGVTELDEVLPGTAGGFQWRLLQEVARNKGWKHPLEATQYISNHKFFKTLISEPTAGMERVKRPTDRKYLNHWEKLLEFQIMERLEKAEKNYFYSSYFAVPKNEKKSRSIFNGKRLSRYFKAPPPVNLMDAPRLIKKIAEWHDKHNGDIYVVNGDLRHWFHQIPLSHEVRPYFGLCMKEMNAEVRWKVLPMGWSWSPYIAQSLAYGFLSYVKEGDVEYVNGACLGDVVLPHFLPLMKDGKEVGFVTVYYDNYLVLSSDAEVAQRMSERILRNEQELHAQIKENTHNLTGPQELRIEDEGNLPVGLDHLGINFRSKKVDEKWILQWQLSPEKVDGRPVEPALRTLRDYAGVIGKCLYPHFISLEPLVLRNEARQLLKLLSKIGKERYRCGVEENGKKKPLSWDSERTACDGITPEDEQRLKAIWERHLTPEIFNSVGTRAVAQTDTIILATDAASKGGWGVVALDPKTGEVIQLTDDKAPRGHRGNFPTHLQEAHIFYKEQ